MECSFQGFVQALDSELKEKQTAFINYENFLLILFCFLFEMDPSNHFKFTVFHKMFQFPL